MFVGQKIFSLIIRSFAFVAFFFTFDACWAGTMTIAPPKGEVLLTIDGAVTANGGKPIEVDLDALKAMPAETFRTSTQWTDGTVEFTGVPLKDLLAAAGATGTSLTATAINNYAVDIPLADVGDDAPIVAYLMNGQTFSRRDKGPLWVVYPYDSSKDYQNELVYNRSIWQLVQMTVK